MKALLLFDIDGTLIDTEGAGLSSLEAGLFEAFPDRVDRPFPPLDLGGATDGSVVAFLFGHFEIEDHASHRERFYESYSAALEQQLKDHGERGIGRVLPGVPELLDTLKEEFPDQVSALLTGNAEIGARMKLRHFGLDSHFSFGAFGDDHHDRNHLGPIAIQRAERFTGRQFHMDQVIVIGDTVKDVRCARACGAKVIAVATGTVSREELEKAEPDALLPDFSDHSLTMKVFCDAYSLARSQ
ncbi:MAG: HAD family hydrolase [Verrucomicrobiales bacterium]|nr:HAD family hydrolase [Verrucomicrobiales bacterium]